MQNGCESLVSASVEIVWKEAVVTYLKLYQSIVAAEKT
jgi:hypothetical protein